MARNKVQFQKGLSEPEFERHYGIEEQCRAAVVASRWPNGFECPACGGTQLDFPQFTRRGTESPRIVLGPVVN
jgi:hypothetical protein